MACATNCPLPGPTSGQAAACFAKWWGGSGCCRCACHTVESDALPLLRALTRAVVKAVSAAGPDGLPELEVAMVLGQHRTTTLERQRLLDSLTRDNLLRRVGGRLYVAE